MCHFSARIPHTGSGRVATSEAGQPMDIVIAAVVVSALAVAGFFTVTRPWLSRVHNPPALALPPPPPLTGGKRCPALYAAARLDCGTRIGPLRAAASRP